MFFSIKLTYWKKQTAQYRTEPFAFLVKILIQNTLQIQIQFLRIRNPSSFVVPVFRNFVPTEFNKL